MGIEKKFKKTKIVRKNNFETNHSIISGVVIRTLRDRKPLNFKGL